MKRFLIILCLICCPIALHLQAQVTKSQSVSLNLLGVQYNYEQPLTEKFTVNFHGGIAGEVGYSALKIGTWYEDKGWMYSLRGIIGTDFRYYYNLKKREEKGKSTKANSGNFWAVDLKYYTPAFVHERINSEYLILVSPYWGIRRVYNNNLLFELNLGLNVGRLGDEWGTGLLSNIKFGYAF